MTRLALILLLLLLPLPAQADDAPPSTADSAEAGGSHESDTQSWRETLLAAQQRLALARGRVAAAQQAYQDSRQRKHPRGAEKAKLLADLDAAEQALAEAEAELPVLLEEARRAGVAPGVLREFED